MRHALILMCLVWPAAVQARNTNDAPHLWSLYFDFGGGTAGGEATGIYGAQLRARFDTFQAGVSYNSGFGADSDFEAFSLLVGHGSTLGIDGLHLNLLGELGHQARSDGVDFFGDSKAGFESTYLGVRTGLDLRMMPTDGLGRQDSPLHFAMGLETFLRYGLDKGELDVGLLLLLGLGLSI